MSDQPNLETALQQLEAIIQELEAGEGTLDEAIALFEKGQVLLTKCQQDLDAKDQKIKQILEDGQLADL